MCLLLCSHALLCNICISLKPNAVILHDLALSVYLCTPEFQTAMSGYVHQWQWSPFVAGDLKHSPTFLFASHLAIGEKKKGGGGWWASPPFRKLFVADK